MGKNFYKTLRTNLPFIDDLIVNDYLNTLGQKLVSQTDHGEQEFKFFILNVPNINAFAGPDAHIGIHSGLFLAAHNESELAGVVAHEISHVTQRHLARAMTEASISPAAAFAAIIAGIIVGSQSPDAGAAIIYGGSAAVMQSQINFTRHNEYEADREAVNVLRKSSINPRGMADFFDTLLSQSESNNVFAQMEYLRTHPLSSNRVAEARHRMKAGDQKLADDSLNFQLCKARLAVISTRSLQNLINRLTQMAPDKQSVVTRYTLAASLIAQGKPDQAISILKQIIKESDHPWIQITLAEAYKNDGQVDKGRVVMEKLNKIYPNYLPVSLTYTELLGLSNKYKEAIALLRKLLQQHQQPLIYQQLAQNYFADGQTALALEATSYQYELDGYLQLAAQQIDNALKQANLDKSSRQRLESRQQQLASQILREQRN